VGIEQYRQFSQQNYEENCNLSHSITLSDTITNIQNIKSNFHQVISNLEQNMPIDLGIKDQPSQHSSYQSYQQITMIQKSVKQFEGVDLLEVFFLSLSSKDQSETN
jgi:hypothetical protein